MKQQLRSFSLILDAPISSHKEIALESKKLQIKSKIPSLTVKFCLIWFQLFVIDTFIAALSNAMIVRIVYLMVNIGFIMHISNFKPTDGVHEFTQSKAGSITAPPQISTVRTIVAI
jgi:hypothetical protein